MNELPISKQDAVAFFRYQIISEMLDAPRGRIEATAKELAKRQFNDIVNKRMVKFQKEQSLHIIQTIKNMALTD